MSSQAIDPILNRIGRVLAIGAVAAGVVYDIAQGQFTQNLHDERLAALEKLTAVDQIVDYQVQRAQVDWELGLLRARVKELEEKLNK
jgi:hypothetical protein